MLTGLTGSEYSFNHHTLRKMKTRHLAVFAFCLIQAGFVHAQKLKNDVDLRISGFIKNDLFYDSRKTVSAREGHFLLWPSPVRTDAFGKDLNAVPAFNMLSIQSRLSVKIKGPDALGAQTSGLIEGDFFGQADGNINLFRLRHAMIRLKWSKTELITGQYWNPLFVTDCFPATLSFNTGVPLVSFARNPQIRLIRTFGRLKLSIAAISQRDYTTRGPDPADNSELLISSDFLRNSSVPDLHLQIKYGQHNEETGHAIIAGTGLEWKRIVPRLTSTLGSLTMKVDESLSSIAAIAYTKIVIPAFTFKIQGRYGENISDLLSVSGFAVRSNGDPETGEQTYTPLTSLTCWTEFHTNGKFFRGGIFCGYLKNLGTRDEIMAASNQVYGLGTDISSLYRISPRITCTVNATTFGLEIEHTAAAYGKDFDTRYRPSTLTWTSNRRILAAVKYNF